MNLFSDNGEQTNNILIIYIYIISIYLYHLYFQVASELSIFFSVMHTVSLGNYSSERFWRKELVQIDVFDVRLDAC